MVVSIGAVGIGHARYQQQAAEKLVAYMSDSARGVAQSFLHGDGWQHLGQVAGQPVEPGVFESILRGEHPTSGKPLGQMQRYTEVHKGLGRVRAPVAGLDFVVSPFDKATSALYVMGTPEQRAALHGVLVKSVQTTLNHAATLMQTRRGKGGRTREFNGATLGICSVHIHNREGNAPQCHVHGFIASSVRSNVDGRWTKHVGRELFRHAHSLGALARLTASHELNRLGIKTVPSKSGGLRAYRVLGLPQSFAHELSSRSNQIADEMHKRGLSTPAEAKRVALETRQPKHELPFPQLRDRCWRVAKRHGVTPDRVESLLSFENRTSAEQLRKRSVPLVARALDSAIDELASMRKPFEPRHLLRAVAERLQASGASPEQVLRAVEPNTLANHPRLDILSNDRGITRLRARERERSKAQQPVSVPTSRKPLRKRGKPVRSNTRQRRGQAPRLRVGQRVRLAQDYHLQNNRVADTALVRLARKLTGINNALRFARSGETGVIHKVKTKRIWRRLPFTKTVVIVRLDWKGRRGFFATRTTRYVRIRLSKARYALQNELDRSGGASPKRRTKTRMVQKVQDLKHELTVEQML